jgi:hypothetical protein
MMEDRYGLDPAARNSSCMTLSHSSTTSRRSGGDIGEITGKARGREGGRGVNWRRINLSEWLGGRILSEKISVKV